MARLTILFTSAGRRVELIECFRRAAGRLGCAIEILACDLEPDLSPACRIADASFAVPRCSDPGYVDAVLAIAEQNGACLVVPTIDPELACLSRAANRFAAIGARVHVSPPEVVDLARDKLATADALTRAGVPGPRTFDLDSARQRDDLVWPLFMKPRAGSASRGLAIVNGPEDLPRTVSEPMIVQELLVGPEYTTNIFVDSSGKLRAAVPHRRLRVRAGEVEKGRTERRADLEEIAAAIVRAIPAARGVLCFQSVLDQERGMMVFEINARFGGGYPLADHAGGEFALWLLEEAGQYACSAHNGWREGVTMLRYDAAVFHG
jgi:carbamoyl-phosphate synthase large subunit